MLSAVKEDISTRTECNIFGERKKKKFCDSVNVGKIK